MPFVVLLAILGLFVGSFLGVLVDRIPKNKPFLLGHSRCDFCKKELRWYELIPVLSFIIQSGKCRNCEKPLSIFYPAIELTTGILFAFTYWLTIYYLQSTTYNLIFYLFIISNLIVVFFTDLKYGIIPNKIVFPAVCVTVLWLIVNHQPLVINHLLTAIGASLFLILISAVYYFVRKKESMGGGDIKFAFLMGIILGFPNIVIAFYIAFLTGAFYSLILILWGRLKLKDAIPFGPFLVLGTFITLYLGEKILSLVSRWLNF
ncbi:MAG: hypothetical protein A2798_02850 [Candidatus Levybacteria bacterium RIFCSPHIGHO2_01_FULL_37_17]|nr:MAG: hypothetical protein A2798_02850 [Candidatus Levybacteria bacterium RIFCSPHIGHO2_01_FULL_37_17]OGH36795.1 MAG: hypothetical protein A2959_00840 [Candidatus Levybacteria bacterium RIFCSPLOWO2_01_FULL_38_23]